MDDGRRAPDIALAVKRQRRVEAGRSHVVHTRTDGYRIRHPIFEAPADRPGQASPRGGMRPSRSSAAGNTPVRQRLFSWKIVAKFTAGWKSTRRACTSVSERPRKQTNTLGGIEDRVAHGGSESRFPLQ